MPQRFLTRSGSIALFRTRNLFRFCALVAVLLPGGTTLSAQWLDPNDPTVRVVLDSEDTQFSFWSGPGGQEEWELSYGAAARTRVKGWQDVTALRFDLASLRGKTIESAELHLAKADTIPVFALVAATINADWHEGTGYGGTAEPGQPCWRWRSMPASGVTAGPEEEWTFASSDFGTASFGNFGSLVSYGFKASGTFGTYSANGQTWMRLKLSPEFVHALVLDQYGLAVTDGRGNNGNYNPRVYTREQGTALQPRLMLRLSSTVDQAGPEAVGGLVAMPGPQDGQVLLRWIAPSDPGADRAFGYDVQMGDSPDPAAGSPVARWRIPRPADPGEEQKVLVEGLEPGSGWFFFIRAYDRTGNLSPLATASLTLPLAQPKPVLPDGGIEIPNPAGKVVASQSNLLRFWACSDLTQVNPVTGNRLDDGYTGTGSDDYKRANLVWDSHEKRISLTGVRNEMVGVQLILERVGSSLHHVRVAVGDLVTSSGARIASATHVELFQLHYVKQGSTFYPDAAIPLGSPFPDSFAMPDPNHNPSGKNQSVWLDFYIPKGAETGEYQGTITVSADELPAGVEIGLSVQVRAVEIPDYPTFFVDLNGYGNPWDFGDASRTALRYFQVCHKHRMSPNTLPYGWSGNVQPDRRPSISAAPNVHASDWSAFDAKYGRFFDGTAFSPDLAESPYVGPGAGTPVATFYTPFFESWPVRLDDPLYGFDAAGSGGLFWNQRLDSTPDYVWENMPDIYGAFSSVYRNGVANVVADWFRHAQDKGWTRTFFQSYLNHKWNYQGCAALWTLEECSVADDFRAVGYLHQLFRNGQAQAQAPDVRWQFRIDISTRWVQHYGQLDDRINLSMINLESSDWHWPALGYRRLQQEEPETWFWYGGGHAPYESSLGSARLFLKGWSQGLDGALPYWDSFQTDWVNAATLSVVYSGQSVPGFGRFDGPVAGVRMKTMRNAQQLIELLNLASRQTGWSRERITRALLDQYGDGDWKRSFEQVDELGLFRLRAGLIALLEAVSPGREQLLPQVAEGPGIQTSFLLLNTDAESHQVLLDARDDLGNPMQFGVQEGSLAPVDSDEIFQLGPGQSRILTTVPAETTRSGAARVTADGPGVVAAGIFWLLKPGGGLLTETGVGASEPAEAFALPVDLAETVNTGIALFNPQAEAMVIQLELVSEDGSPVGQSQEVLYSRGHLARFIGGPDGLFPGVQPMRGTLRLQAAKPFAALVLRQDLTRGNLTTLPATPLASQGTEWYLPHFADGRFPQGSIRSSILLFSLSDEESSVSLSFTNQSGLPVAVAFDGDPDSRHEFVLKKGQSLFLESDGTAGSTNGLLVGAVRVTADRPIGIAGIFTLRDPAGRFLTETGIGTATVRSESSMIVDNRGAVSTGAAFFNPSDQPVTLILQLFDEGTSEEGSVSLVGTRTLELGPSAQTALFIENELFPGVTLNRGSLTIQGPVATLTLRQNGDPLSFTTMPVAGGAFHTAGIGVAGIGPDGSEEREAGRGNLSDCGQCAGK